MRFTGVLLFLTPVVLTPAQAFFQRARLLDRFLSAPSMDLVRQQAALFRDEKVERFDKRAVLGSAPPAWTDAASNHALYAAINESGTWESPEQARETALAPIIWCFARCFPTRCANQTAFLFCSSFSRRDHLAVVELQLLGNLVHAGASIPG